MPIIVEYACSWCVGPANTSHTVGSFHSQTQGILLEPMHISNATTSHFFILCNIPGLVRLPTRINVSVCVHVQSSAQRNCLEHFIQTSPSLTSPRVLCLADMVRRSLQRICS